MLDIKYVRENIEEVIERLNTRGGDFSYLREIITLDEKRREIITKVEVLKANRNDVSKAVGQYKREGKDATDLLRSVENIGDDIKKFDEEIAILEDKINVILAKTPNTPNRFITIGHDETQNKEIKRVGTVPTFNFEPKAHWEIATNLDIIDFERAAKITGSRFAVYKGLGARLERALMNFFLDTNTSAGYTEILPPVIVNDQSLYGTGQLPKFQEDLFKLEGSNHYLIPTSEVPVTNLHAQEVINVEETVKYTAFSSCFRSEAGSAGRDTRGIIRQHQFNKVELVNFAHPERSYEELENLTAQAESLLEKLGLPYRRIELCTGDIGFSSAKTYDLEVWLPSYNAYKEISSCSNFEDFQARRANIKFRDEEKKTRFVHTLNGSGLAIGRTVAAILENFQNEDGTVRIPEVLIQYMGAHTIK